MSANPQVAFCDLNRIYLDQKTETDAAVARVLASGWFILGKECAAFESAMLKDLDPPQSRGGVVGCNSGTDALILPLLEHGVGPGDEVIVPSHTAIPTITAVQSTGATPVFCDIDPETWVMDTRLLRGLISASTRAIIPVHIYGNMADIPAVQRAIGDRTDIALIEDCAQAQGSRMGAAQAGTLGDFGAYSFYPTKNLGAMGDGGAVYSKHAERVERLKMLRFYGQKDRYNALVARGLNSRLDEVQAAILSVRLGKLHAGGERKASLMRRYRDELSGLPLRFQRETQGCTPNWHLAVIRLENTQTRDALMERLGSQGIQTIIHYPKPTHTQPAFSAATRARDTRLPETESLASQILSLPMYPLLTDTEQGQIIQTVRSFFK